MITSNLIQSVVNKLVIASHPVRVILFGSCARNQMVEDSDLDLLIIEEQIENKGNEMVRLRNVIGNVGVGVDLLVYSQHEVDEWGHLPGTALYSALKEGRVVYETMTLN